MDADRKHAGDGRTVLQQPLSAPPTHPALKAALADFRRALVSVMVFSAAVNLLMLAGPLYMLQIYDRVLASRSVPTLLALSVILVIAYAFLGWAPPVLILRRLGFRTRGEIDLERTALKALRGDFSGVMADPDFDARVERAIQAAA